MQSSALPLGHGAVNHRNYTKAGDLSTPLTRRIRMASVRASRMRPPGMSKLSRFLLLPAAVVGFTPSFLSAQGEDSRVTPPGMVRLRVEGVFSAYDRRFGSPFSGGDDGEQLSAPFQSRLTSSSYLPLQTLESGLNGFFVATDTTGSPFQAGPGNLFWDTGRVAASAADRVVPVALEVGVLPRVSAGGSITFTRHELSALELGISGGTVGINPDPVYNDSLLTLVGDGFGALGRSPILPLAGSPAGDALREQVLDATGAELRLPASLATGVVVEGVSLAGFAEALEVNSGPAGWRVANASATTKLQLLDELDRDGLGVRAAVRATLRFPLGPPPSPEYYLHPEPRTSFGGAGAEVIAELALSRLLLNGSAAWWWHREREVRVGAWQAATDTFPPVYQLAVVRVAPGTEWKAAFSPGYQLTRQIWLGAGWRYQRRGPDLYGWGQEPLFPAQTGTRSSHHLTVGARYSTLSRYLEGGGVWPLEAWLGYRRAVAGGGGAPDSGAVEVVGKVYVRLWSTNP